jgi:hypothetical protein
MTWQWTLGPRIAGKALHELNDNELSRSAKTDTLYYTVVHLSFWMKRENSAGMAELADAADSKSADLRVLGVRLPLPAPRFFPRSSVSRLRFCCLSTTEFPRYARDRSSRYPDAGVHSLPGFRYSN